MSTLILDLRKGDMMVVNGAAMRFRSRTRVELTARARFLFGRQIMAPNEADSPARRIYYALQTAYIGEAEERQSGLEEALLRIQEFKQATNSTMAKNLLDAAWACAHADSCYQALRLVRRVVAHEDAVLGRVPSPSQNSGEQGEERPGGIRAGGAERGGGGVASLQDRQQRIARVVGAAK